MSLVVNIAKNEKIELSKHSNVSEVEIGLSWEANSTPSRPFANSPIARNFHSVPCLYNEPTTMAV
jgi:stress response protein SCP2